MLSTLKKIALCITVSTLFSFSIGINAQTTALTPLSHNVQFKAYLQQLEQQYNFSATQLKQWFSQVKPNPDVIAHMNKPYENQPWFKYRTFFINQNRITNGVKFWRKHAATLKRVEKQYGVPANIIVAIIGIESLYGKQEGTYRVIDSLTTLAFYYPQRAQFFKQQLTNFLLLARKQGTNPLSVKGSYAGAFGLPQFMPSSFNSYAVDYSKNQHIDLTSNADDAIASIANYLAKNGWQHGQLIAVPAHVSPTELKRLAVIRHSPPDQRNPIQSVSSFGMQGITPSLPIDVDSKVVLIQLHSKHHYDYWLGLNNFQTIMRYNHSDEYAMAVYVLGEIIHDVYYQELVQGQTPALA